jgi:predicted HAD superfamily phosphohydrolase YqeG
MKTAAIVTSRRQELVRRAMRDLGFRPEEVVVIGDSDR